MLQVLVAPTLGILLSLLGAPFGAIVVPSFAVAAPTAPWDGIRWGESSPELVRDLSPQAKVLSRSIEFGDSYVDVVAPNQMLGGFTFTILFQMDKTTRGLKRVMVERQRHGANPKVYRAVLQALEAVYGPPARVCDMPAAGRNGYQAASERIWLHDDLVIRATFRDTTIEASEGCLFVATMSCGLTAQLFIQISPPEPSTDACRWTLSRPWPSQAPFRRPTSKRPAGLLSNVPPLAEEGGTAA